PPPLPPPPRQPCRPRALGSGRTGTARARDRDRARTLHLLFGHGDRDRARARDSARLRPLQDRRHAAQGPACTHHAPDGGSPGGRWRGAAPGVRPARAARRAAVPALRRADPLHHHGRRDRAEPGSGRSVARDPHRPARPLARRTLSLHATINVERNGFALSVDMTVFDGETVAVLGPNGAGKTTLLRALAGLVRITGHVE